MSREWVPPELCLEAARWLLVRAPSSCVVKLLKVAGDLFPDQRVSQGFQVTEQVVERAAVRRVLVERMAPLLVEMEPLRLLLFVHSYPQAPWHRWNGAMVALDGDWVVANWRRLLKATGDPAVVVAMALDERHRIARRGARLLLVPWLWEKGLEFHAAELPEELMDLVQLVGGGRSKGLDEAAAAVRAEAQRAEREAARLKKRLREREGRLKELEGEVRRLREAVSRERKRADGLQARLQGMEQELDERVDAGVREVLSTWVGEEILGELAGGAIHPSSAEELLDQADAALRAQRAMDPRCGSRSAIRRWIERLEAKLREVEAAREDSLHPSKALARVAHQLREEIERLRGVLEQGGLSDVEEQGADELETGGGKVPSTPAMIGPGVKRMGRKPHSGPEEIAQLSAFVARHGHECARGTLVVDGYNAIKSMASWRRMEGLDFRQARERFVSLLRRRSSDWRAVEVVFDGQGRLGEAEKMDNLTVVFTSDIGESQRADAYIVERLKLLAQEGKGPLFLITADRELRSQAAPWCNYFIDPRWAALTYLSP